MIDIARQQILPAVLKYGKDLAGAALKMRELSSEIDTSVEIDLIKKLTDLGKEAAGALQLLERETEKAAAKMSAEAYRDKVIPAMERLRKAVDELELYTASEYWPLPSYCDLLYSVR